MRADRRSQSMLRRFWRALVRGRWTVATCLVAPIVPAIALTLADDQQYRAEAEMVIRQLPSDVAADAVPIDPERRVLNEIAVLEGQDVADRVRADLGITGALPEVTGSTDGSVDVIVVRVDGPTAQLAATLANAYVAAYTEVEADRLSQSLQAAITQHQLELDGLHAQIEGLPADDPLMGDLIESESIAAGALELMTTDLAVAAAPVEVIRPATPPDHAIDASLWRPALLSLGVGVVLSAVGVALLHRPSDDVLTAADLGALRSTEPVLAVVPSERTSHERPIVVRQPLGRAEEAYDRLRLAMQRIMDDRGARVVLFCSPNEGEGSTTTAANLAVVMARAGTRVALVDLDLRDPRLHTMFGLQRAPGVTDSLIELTVDDSREMHRISALDRLARMDHTDGYLMDVDDDDDGVGDFGQRVAATVLAADDGDHHLVEYDDSGEIDRRLDPAVDRGVGAFEGGRRFDDLTFDALDTMPLSIPVSYFESALAVITAGTPPHSALEVLSRRRMGDLFDELRRTYDIVILDAPAVLTAGDAATIARHVDGVVLVVRSGSSSLPAVRQALGTVERAGARIFGVVLAGSST